MEKEDIVTKKFKELVRAEFGDLPLNEFNAYYAQILESLGYSKQIELMEKASELTQVDSSPSLFTFSFSQLPIDIIAMLMTNLNNSTIRAWCRVEKKLYENCLKLVEKIIKNRNEWSCWEAFLKRHTKINVEMYPVEALITMELGKTMFNVIDDSDWTEIEFSNIKTKNKAIFINKYGKSSPNMYIWPINNRNEYARKWLSTSVQTVIEGGAMESYYELSNTEDIRENVEVFMFNALVIWSLKVAKVIGSRTVDIVSKKDGKPFVYKGPRDLEFEQLTCSICDIKPKRLFQCGNLCGTMYCDKNCAKQDWQDHRLKCVPKK